jgi:hypothetical protein
MMVITYKQRLTLELLVHIHDVSIIADDPLCTCVCARKGQHKCHDGDIMLTFIPRFISHLLQGVRCSDYALAHPQ